MKTSKNLLAVFIAVFAFNVVLASGNLKVNVVSNEADLTVVEISNFKMSNFEIEVTDEYGENLYEMKTKAPVNEFKKRYDFSGLEDGIYWYSVKIDKEKITKKLEIENGKVDVLEISKVVEPFFVQHDDLLKFSMLNFQQEDVKLFVYGPDNKLLTEADLGNDFTINKALNLAKLRSGTYEVVISHDSDTYEHTFSVN